MFVKKFILAVTVIILGGLFVYVVWPRYIAPPDIPDFAISLARELPDWTWEDRPLSDSQEYLKVIEEELGFDGAIYRLYSKDDLLVAIYAAYWAPGKKDYRSVSNHIPDVCWVNNGWNVEDRVDALVLETSAGRLIPGQFRVMEKGGSLVDVLFWFLVDGKHFGRGKVLEDILGSIKVQRSGNYFLRISANQRIESLMGDPEFLKIVDGLAQYGLYEK